MTNSQRSAPMPPAKYKLWLNVLTLVYLADCVASGARLLKWIESWRLLSPNFSLFLYLAILVFVLVYAALDVYVACLTIHIGDKVYGLGYWMTAPRVQWIHQYDNFFMDLVKIAVHILEKGFDMFWFRTPEMILQSREQARLKVEESLTTRIEHRIASENVEAYNSWKAKIALAVLDMGGCIQESSDGETGAEKSSLPTALNQKRFVLVLKFKSSNLLKTWMTSPIRIELAREVDQIAINTRRARLSIFVQDRRKTDAFTDLLVSQGQASPVRPPKKWKVTWLTTIALYFSIIWTRQFLPYYFPVWHLDTAHERVQALVRIMFSTFLNTFVMTPLLLFIFGDWVSRKEDENDVGSTGF